ncbi:MAG: hypothetical protein KatS3mg110_0706 [Pirellulaceae bacterium]|nr:MAG: hypothetical protein KatS3mg110_0706 [Pirellulaceae bacterium]
MLGLWNWFVVLAAMQDVTASNEIERVLEVERRTVAARQAIERGQYRLIQKTLNASGHVTNLTTFWMVFDGNRLRVDQQYREQASGIQMERKFIFDNGICIDYRRSLQPAGLQSAVQVSPLRKYAYACPPLYEPRIIGMTTLPLTSRTRLNEFVGATSGDIWERKSARMWTENVDGHSAVITEHLLTGIDMPGDATRTIWIVPALDYNVVKLEFRMTVNGQPLLDRHVNSVRAYQGDNGTVWFPEWARTERYLSGRLSHAFEVEIQEAAFNKPVDPKAFTLAGLNLPPGASVHDDIKGRAYKWDGKQLVERYVGDRWWAEEQAKLKALGDKASSVWSTAEALKVFTEPVQTKKSTRWVWWCTAAALSAIGIICLGIGTRRWLKRRATP